MNFLLIFATTLIAGMALSQRTREIDDSEVTAAVRKLRQLLKARVYGNHEQLRIEGRYANTDVAVVFDGSRGNSQLTVEVPSPQGFSLWTASKADGFRRESQLLTWVHPTKALLSNDVTLASSLVADASISRTLSRLSDDPRFSLALRDGMLRVSGKVEPDRLSDHFVPELVKEMTYLVRNLDAEPEVQFRNEVAARRIRTRRKLSIALVCLAALAATALAGYLQHRSHRPSAWLRPVAKEGWRPTQAEDSDKESAAILQQHGQAFTSRITGDFTGRGSESGEAEFFTSTGGNDSDAPTFRVVIQTDPPTYFEQTYPDFAFALKVTNRNLHKMGWVGEKPPALSNRDAVLIVQQRTDIRSGLFLLFDGKQIRVYRPEDYRLF